MVRKPFTGFGIGLRPPHYQTVIQQTPDVDWFELLTEDYLVDGGVGLEAAEAIVRNYPVALHGVSLSIGSADPLNDKYLSDLNALIRHLKPLWVSDHFCWTGINGINLHDLLPLPYNDETVQHLVPRIDQVQQKLGQQILLENISSYLTFEQSTMPEWAFINEVAYQSGCAILLDINNIYVNAFNHGFNSYDFINSVEPKFVRQFHIAGHSKKTNHIIDTHDSPISRAVWDLYALAVKRFPLAATIIERDAKIPSLDELCAELSIAKKIGLSENEYIV